MTTLHKAVQQALELLSVGRVQLAADTLSTALQEPVQEPVATNSQFVQAVRRLVIGFEHVSGIARLWEPDHASGPDRAKWANGTEACADVAKFLNRPEFAPMDRYGVVYEFDTPFGLHKSFECAPYNGQRPTRAVEVFEHPAPQPVELSDEEIEALAREMARSGKSLEWRVRAVIAAHQRKQEGKV